MERTEWSAHLRESIREYQRRRYEAHDQWLPCALFTLGFVYPDLAEALRAHSEALRRIEEDVDKVFAALQERKWARYDGAWETYQAWVSRAVYDTTEAPS